MIVIHRSLPVKLSKVWAAALSLGIVVEPKTLSLVLAR
jgi:hypothetical protein